jgi:hypothetical protein
MDAVFFKAANPPQFKCLGATLLPLTIGHLFLLRKYCPDIFSEEEIERGTLAVATFICAHPQAEVEGLFRRRLANFIFKLWAWLSQKRNTAIESGRFEAYLEASLDPPKVWRDLSEPLNHCQSPLELGLLVRMMTDLHYTEAAALELPVVKANALRACHGELLGKFSFADARTEGLFEFARRMEAEKKNKEN